MAAEQCDTPAETLLRGQPLPGWAGEPTLPGAPALPFGPVDGTAGT